MLQVEDFHHGVEGLLVLGSNLEPVAKPAQGRHDSAGNVAGPKGDLLRHEILYPFGPAVDLLVQDGSYLVVRVSLRGWD